MRWNKERRVVVFDDGREIDPDLLEPDDLDATTADVIKQCIRAMEGRALSIGSPAPHAGLLNETELEDNGLYVKTPPRTIIHDILPSHDGEDIEISAFIVNPTEQDEEGIRSKISPYMNGVGARITAVSSTPAKGEWEVSFSLRPSWEHINEAFEITSNIWSMLRYGEADAGVSRCWQLVWRGDRRRLRLGFGNRGYGVGER